MKWVLLLLISFPALAVDVKAGKYRFCGSIIHFEKRPLLLFNFHSRQQLRVELKGPIADDLIPKSKHGNHRVTIHVQSDQKNKPVIEATLLAVKECGKGEAPLSKIGDNFEPRN